MEDSEANSYAQLCQAALPVQANASLSKNGTKESSLMGQASWARWNKKHQQPVRLQRLPSTLDPSLPGTAAGGIWSPKWPPLWRWNPAKTTGAGC